MSEQAQTDVSALTVTALATQLGHALSRAFPTVVSVEGELTNFKAYPSGHWYFSITDGDASLSCAMFKAANRTVRLVARDGLKVRLTVEINFYPPNGRLQLIARRMVEAGLGDQKARLDALRAKLVAEGLTDPARKRPLPRYPMTIGVITSPKGAVIRDICTVLAHRWPLAEIRL
ncbi:MAG: exodeoxyribonuclease VII large subunit, partial [Gammaproteobacteria bacterium]|nr:exodeoxyribonuclease VII large subunit [Gammaproteobacteria bacterium]